MYIYIFVTAYDRAAQEHSSHLQARASSGQDRREQGLYNESYTKAKAYGRSSDYDEDNQFDQSYRDDFPQHLSASGDNRYDQSYRDDVSQHLSGLGDNRYDQSYRDDIPQHLSSSGGVKYDPPYSQDDRKRKSYLKSDYMERPYLEDVGAFPDDGTNERRYMDESVPQTYRSEWYPETSPSRGPFKSRDDDDDDDYHGNILENRFGESEIDYQESGRMRDPIYTSHHGTGPSMDERQRPNRNLPYTETGRECFDDVDETGRCGSFEMQGFNKRQQYYQTEDDIPSKKKRKSKFSDASPLEMAVAQNR